MNSCQQHVEILHDNLFILYSEIDKSCIEAKYMIIELFEIHFKWF